MTLRPELSRASWRRMRKYVRRRDGDRCQVCGSNGWIPAYLSKSGRWMKGRYLLVVGHIVPAERYQGRHDDPANLRTMCVSCNNSQRDLADVEWREARAARGQAIGIPSVATEGMSRRPIESRTIFGTRPRVF